MENTACSVVLYSYSFWTIGVFFLENKEKVKIKKLAQGVTSKLFKFALQVRLFECITDPSGTVEFFYLFLLDFQILELRTPCKELHNTSKYWKSNVGNLYSNFRTQLYVQHLVCCTVSALPETWKQTNTSCFFLSRQNHWLQD